SGTLTAVNAQALTLIAGAPTHLALAVQPSAGAQAGAALAQQPQVQLRDQSDHPAPVAGTGVTATLVSGAPTISNATATTNASGLATFSGLALSGTSGSYTFHFSAPNLTAVNAAAATVLSAGASTQLAVLTQPSANAQNGGTLAVQPVVQLRD